MRLEIKKKTIEINLASKSEESYSTKLTKYLEELESNKGWRPAYGISASAEQTTVLSSCFAALIYELSAELERLSESDRATWVEYLQSFQNADSGLFIDPLANENEFAGPKYDWQYFTWQTTFFCLSALDALGQKALHALEFVQPYRSAAAIHGWLEGLDWRDPWLESNRIMFLASFLIQTGDLQNAHIIFDWLDQRQDPHTGYWGTEQGADLLNAMAGAFHFYFLYLYLQRPIKYIQRIIDSTLNLQQPDGLYHPRGGGGACLDLDAVDILVKLSLLTDYRQEEIHASLQRTRLAILANQRPDGSFCEAVRPPARKSAKRRAAELLRVDRILYWRHTPARESTNFSGWDVMKYYVDEGDLWSSWFRLLTLTVISVYENEPFSDQHLFRYRNGPYLGWHNPDMIAAIKGNAAL